MQFPLLLQETSYGVALPYDHRELCLNASTAIRPGKHPRQALQDKLCHWRPPYLVKSGEREMTCWNSERLMVPSLSMSDSSRICRGGKGEW